MVLALSNSPRTRCLNRSASILRCKTWCIGARVRGIQTFPPFALARSLFNAEISTTFGEDENLITSRYNTFASADRDRTVVGVHAESGSDSSESDSVDGSNGGVGGRDTGSNNGGSDWISRRRSLPLRYEFSVRRKRTVPRKDSIYEQRISEAFMKWSFLTWSNRYEVSRLLSTATFSTSSCGVSEANRD
jgi:hypothetical protein